MSPISIPDGVLDMPVGHLVDLSLQGLVVERSSTFRELLEEILAHSNISGRSFVGLLRPALYQIYQVRSAEGEIKAKEIRVTEKDRNGEDVTVIKKGVETDITTHIPQWAEGMRSMVAFGDDASVSEMVSQALKS